VAPQAWFSDEPGTWEWKGPVINELNCAYGKFFEKKAVYISKEWFPDFANYRRDGYDFDAAWDDELVQRRYKAIMDICEDGGMHPGFELKPAAGFGKDGYKNFDGCITQLQMQTYLIIRKFERRRNKRGQSYGMAVSYYQKPEELWGYEHVTSAYKEDPSVSAERIFARAKEVFPEADDAALRRIL
jgi:hypothetical protein